MPAGYRRFCTTDGTPLLPADHSRSGRLTVVPDAAIVTPDDLGAPTDAPRAAASTDTKQAGAGVVDRELERRDWVAAVVRSLVFGAAMTGLLVGASWLPGSGAEERPTLPSPYSVFELGSEPAAVEASDANGADRGADRDASRNTSDVAGSAPNAD